MISRVVAIVLLTYGCGEVIKQQGDAGTDHVDASGEMDAVVAVVYQGSVQQTPAVPFGGAPYCDYTIMLRRLEIDLEILASRQVISGTVKALNVEGTDASCPNGVIPATMVSYTLESAVDDGDGIQLRFQGAPNNAPAVDLTGVLSLSGAAYSAALTFHRSDQGPPLDWTVMTSLPLVAR